MSVRAPNGFSVAELKDKLKSRGLATSGTKTELITRLMDADPAGSWTREEELARVEETAGGDQETGSSSDLTRMQRELLLARKEEELAKRELELARKEIQMLQGMQQLNLRAAEHAPRASDFSNSGEITGSATTQLMNEHRPVSQEATHRVNVTAIAELLNYFDGRSDYFETWERQVLFLKDTYRLTEEHAKILIGSKLRGKASEWFHSKADHLVMPVKELLENLRRTFHYRPSKIMLRRQFEQRTWKREESFSEYLHQKVILANYISIDEDETIEYIIDGIPDAALRDQARVQRLRTREDLLEAFESISLRGRFQGAGSNPRISDRPRVYRDEQLDEREATVVKCHRCGQRNHYAVNCPTKNRGMKCYLCGDFGHISSSCPKRKCSERDTCNVSQSAGGKYYKDVEIRDQKVIALIDTGSDITLMRAEQYIKLGSPKLVRNEISLRGIGSEDNRTLGEFTTDMVIDGNIYPIIIRVVSDTLMRHGLLIGTDFLDSVEVNIREGKISISKPRGVSRKEEVVPEILNIDRIETNEIDLSHVNVGHRETVRNLIASYSSCKTRETEVKEKREKIRDICEATDSEDEEASSVSHKVEKEEEEEEERSVSSRKEDVGDDADIADIVDVMEPVNIIPTSDDAEEKATCASPAGDEKLTSEYEQLMKMVSFDIPTIEPSVERSFSSDKVKTNVLSQLNYHEFNLEANHPAAENYLFLPGRDSAGVDERKHIDEAGKDADLISRIREERKKTVKKKSKEKAKRVSKAKKKTISGNKKL